jgi:hypothetical protein
MSSVLTTSVRSTASLAEPVGSDIQRRPPPPPPAAAAARCHCSSTPPAAEAPAAAGSPAAAAARAAAASGRAERRSMAAQATGQGPGLPVVPHPPCARRTRRKARCACVWGCAPRRAAAPAPPAAGRLPSPRPRLRSQRGRLSSRPRLCGVRATREEGGPGGNSRARPDQEPCRARSPGRDVARNSSVRERLSAPRQRCWRAKEGWRQGAAARTRARGAHGWRAE